jgi:DNA-binding PadR family transcriptional regulator
MRKQVNYLILKFLKQVYPDSLTVKMIEALLADWRIFTDSKKLLEKNIKYLLEKGYIEVLEVELPTHQAKIQKLRLTAKGKALLEKEVIDEQVEEV